MLLTHLVLRLFVLLGHKLLVLLDQLLLVLLVSWLGLWLNWRWSINKLMLELRLLHWLLLLLEASSGWLREGCGLNIAKYLRHWQSQLGSQLILLLLTGLWLVVKLALLLGNRLESGHGCLAGQLLCGLGQNLWSKLLGLLVGKLLLLLLLQLLLLVSFRRWLWREGSGLQAGIWGNTTRRVTG